MKQCGEIGRFCEMTGQVGRDIADDPFFPVFLLKMILNTDFRKHLQDQRIQYVRRARSMELVQTLKHTVEQTVERSGPFESCMSRREICFPESISLRGVNEKQFIVPDSPDGPDHSSRNDETDRWGGYAAAPFRAIDDCDAFSGILFERKTEKHGIECAALMIMDMVRHPADCPDRGDSG